MALNYTGISLGCNYEPEKPTLCKPMDQTRERIALEGIKNSSRDPLVGALMHWGACSLCKILYCWRGAPSNEHALCLECQHLLDGLKRHDFRVSSFDDFILMDCKPKRL